MFWRVQIAYRISIRVISTTAVLMLNKRHAKRDESRIFDERVAHRRVNSYSNFKTCLIVCQWVISDKHLVSSSVKKMVWEFLVNNRCTIGYYIFVVADLTKPLCIWRQLIWCITMGKRYLMLIRVWKHNVWNQC